MVRESITHTQHHRCLDYTTPRTAGMVLLLSSTAYANASGSETSQLTGRSFTPSLRISSTTSLDFLLDPALRDMTIMFLAPLSAIQ